MLTDLGIPLLRWLDDVVIPQAGTVLLDFERYVKRWRKALGDETPDWFDEL